MELKNLSAEQLSELHSKLGEVLDILNPEQLSYTELCEAGMERTIKLELLGMEVFGEIQKRFFNIK